MTESKFEESNPYIHSGNELSVFPYVRYLYVLILFFESRIDISDEFSFEHMLEFAKLAAAFAIELGQWED